MTFFKSERIKTFLNIHTHKHYNIWNLLGKHQILRETFFVKNLLRRTMFDQQINKTDAAT